MQVDEPIDENPNTFEHNPYNEEESVHLNLHEKRKNKIGLKTHYLYNTQTPDPRFPYDNKEISIDKESSSFLASNLWVLIVVFREILSFSQEERTRFKVRPWGC